MLVVEVLERVRAAIHNSVLSWPTGQVTATTSNSLIGDTSIGGTSLTDLAVACCAVPPGRRSAGGRVHEWGVDGLIALIRTCYRIRVVACCVQVLARRNRPRCDHHCRFGW
jgi:hypothetical protein